MSRWQPVSESIKKQEQSDGCGRLLVIMVVLIVCIAAVFGAWKLGTHPRCWACNHFRHENRMCGSLMNGMGTCICEKDKK